jgi:O-methyltransferase
MSVDTTAPTLAPQAVVMQMVTSGYVARALSEISRMGVPDILHRAGPMSAAALVADGVDADVPTLDRVMRLCSSVGLFTEDATGRFGATPLSEVLTSDAVGSVKVLAEEMGGTWMQSWMRLSEALKTGEPQMRPLFGMDWWDYLKANPKEMERFAEAMKSNSLNSLRGVLEYCDFAQTRTVVDVGGGLGHLAVALLERYPHLHGILVDLPDVVAMARARLSPMSGIASRLECVGTDMFVSVPRADTYVLKHIIHDWDDDRCVRLLRNCRESIDGNGRIFCVDAVLPPMGDTSGAAAKILDIMVMLAVGGRERTRDQWEALYGAAGFRISRITPLEDNFGTSIIEGIKE